MLGFENSGILSDSRLLHIVRPAEAQMEGIPNNTEMLTPAAIEEAIRTLPRAGWGEKAKVVAWGEREKGIWLPIMILQKENGEKCCGNHEILLTWAELVHISRCHSNVWPHWLGHWNEFAEKDYEKRFSVAGRGRWGIDDTLANRVYWWASPPF